MMRFFKICAPSDQDGNLYIFDAVRYKGGVWIVGQWLEAPALGHKRPSHIVRLPSDCVLQKAAPGYPFHFHSGSYSIPSSWLDPTSEAVKSGKLVVENEPPLIVSIPKGIH